jgi:hypothetical protein
MKEPHGVTSKKTPFFIVTAVKISNLFSAVGPSVKIVKELLIKRYV